MMGMQEELQTQRHGLEDDGSILKMAGLLSVLTGS
jgi:hypothetical protein